MPVTVKVAKPDESLGTTTTVTPSDRPTAAWDTGRLAASTARATIVVGKVLSALSVWVACMLATPFA